MEYEYYVACFFNTHVHKHLMVGCMIISLEYRIYALVNYVSIGSGNGVWPVRRQAITWTNVALLSIRPLDTKFSDIWNKF